MENNLVVKANVLNESRYKLGLNEQRIILTMISLINPDDRDFKPYSFTIKDFARLVGVKGQNIYSRVKKITKSLRDKGFTIKEATGDLQLGWVSSVKYYDNEGRLELMFDPALKPYLLALKKEFTRYQLKNTVRLRSVYSVRIYELLKQYQSLEIRTFQLDDLRASLGIPEKKLQPYGNFKRKVLDIAANELKKNSDIYFYYTPVKSGRKVIGVEFHIKINESVVKGSYKKKDSVPENINEKQLDLLEQSKIQSLDDQLRLLRGQYPEKYQKLEKQGKKRLTKDEKKKPGQKLLIKFKMHSLLPGFLQKEKIELMS